MSADSARKRSQSIDRVVACVVWGVAILVGATFIWLLADVVWQGMPAVSQRFLLTPPTDAGRAGGIGPIVVSTLSILAVCLVTAVPIGIGTALLLSEVTAGERWYNRLVRRSLDVLAGVPSIVFGLFGNALFSQILGLGFSILSGGLTLACMILPLLIRTLEQGLRQVPAEYRRGAAALGLSRLTTTFEILLPAALPALIVGLVLGIGRALAETAALLFTSGYVDRMPESLYDSGRALTVHIYDLAMNVPGGNRNAYASAFVLVVLLVVINALAALVAARYLKRSVVR